MHTYGKTAISVDDRLMLAADRLARKMGISRSRLFSLAIEAYLRNLEQDNMLEQLNRVYADDSAGTERRLAKQLKAKFRATIKERW